MKGQSSNVPVFGVKMQDHDSLNARLREKLLTQAETVPDAVTNQTRGGRSYFENKWLSKPDLHQRGDEDFNALVTFVEQTANQVLNKPDPAVRLAVRSMWAIVSKTGLEGRPHSHQGRVSAAYYVDAGTSSKKDGGAIQFLTKGLLGIRQTHSVYPESGGLLLFPSTLLHTVSLYRGSAPRIVISLNLA